MKRCNWINLYERMDDVCPTCGNIPSQLMGKTLRESFPLKNRKERRKKYGDLLICSLCVQTITDPPKGTVVEKKIKRPRGWNAMKEFVDLDGSVFFKGVEQKRLKGKLPITDLSERKPSKSKKNKISKWQKADTRTMLASEIFKLKKEIKKLTNKPKTKIQINKLQREIKKITQQLKK